MLAVADKSGHYGKREKRNNDHCSLFHDTPHRESYCADVLTTTEVKLDVQVSEHEGAWSAQWNGAIGEGLSKSEATEDLLAKLAAMTALADFIESGVAD